MTDQYLPTNINAPRSPRETDANLTLTLDDEFIIITANAPQITLPTAAQIPSRDIYIKSVPGTGSVVGILGQTIDGAGSFTFTTANEAILVKSNGANWFLVSGGATSGGVSLQAAYNGGPLIVTSGNTIDFSGAAGAGGFSVSMVDAVAIGVATQTTANTSGNTLTLTSGDGLGTGSGGAASLTGGGAGATGSGGQVLIDGGAGGATTGSAGGIFLSGGLVPGTAGAGGNVNITGANSVGAFSGVNCQMGSGDAGTVGTGGGIIISSGDGGSVSGNGGVVQLTAGDAPLSGNGGDVELRAGSGSDDNGRVIVTPNFANADTDEYVTFVATGTNPPNSGGTQNVRMLAGGRDPNGNVTATPGSLYLRGSSTGSLLYVNTTSGTAPGTTWVPSGAGVSVPVFAVSGVLTTGARPFRFRSRVAGTIVRVQITVGTAPTGEDPIIVDVDNGGTTIFTTQSNRPEITENNTEGNTTTINLPTVAVNDEFTVEIDQIGNTTPGSDLLVEIEIAVNQ